MKRYGYLFSKVCNFHSLTTAAKEAARGKKDKTSIALFLQHNESEAIKLELQLLEKTYCPRPYRTFMVYDPKERQICAADFRDRVVHHAVCRVLEPIFERTFIFDSYACRKGKGTHSALNRAQEFCNSFPFFLKLDIHKFFNSIDHQTMKVQLRRKIKDSDLLWLLDIFIDHPVPWTKPGKGIPIGNLTSQHFANFHLSSLDHFIKENIGINAYIRYMDDFLLFAYEKERLWEAYYQIERFINEKLHLRFKKRSFLLSPVFQGLPFLGFRIFPQVIRLSRKGWRRFRNKVIKNKFFLSEGIIDEDEFIRSMMSLIGHIQHANTRNLRRVFFERLGVQEALTG